VTWDYPPAVDGTGQVEIPAGSQVGAKVPVWVDDSGQLTSPPSSGSEVIARVVIEGFGCLVALLLVCAVVAVLRRRVLDRRAEGTWGAAWERVEPVWSGRNQWRPGT